MEIIKLKRDHHRDVLELLNNDIPNYRFLMNDLMDDNEVYGEYENQKLVSILLNNDENITYYAQTDRSVQPYEEVLGRLNFSKLSGPSRLVDKFLPYVKAKSDVLSYMGVVKNITVPRQHPQLAISTIHSEEEIGMLYDLFSSTEEYPLQENRKDYIDRESRHLQSMTGRIVYLSVDNRMVTSCATVKEMKDSAIITGVVTHPEYRNKGYGTEILIGLFDQLLAEGKYAYLFYNNPAARSVYKKIGMTEVCEWRVMTVE